MNSKHALGKLQKKFFFCGPATKSLIPHPSSFFSSFTQIIFFLSDRATKKELFAASLTKAS